MGLTTCLFFNTLATSNIKMPDPYEGIDFEEISEATGLAVDEIKCLKVCFDLFDTNKQDFLSADDLGEIMRAMGFRPTEEELKDLLKEIDEDGSGEIEIGEFCQLCHLPGGGPRHGDDEEGAEGRVQDLRQGGAGLHRHRDLEGLDRRAAGALDQRRGRGHPRGARRGWLRLDGL